MHNDTQRLGHDRLGPDQLAHLPPGIRRPKPGQASDAPGNASPRIVHLGLGAFARAHLAEYTQDADDASGENWHIIGVSLQRPDMALALAPQQGLYTLVTRAPEGPQRRVMDVVRECLVAPESPAAVVAVMADSATHIVSLTVTEKGYCHDPATGRLNLDHPEIVHDLAQPDAPRSAIGMVVAGLDARHARALPPFTVLCCDNLPSNGDLLRALVLDFAAKRSPELAAWIAHEGAFPSTMVDRIVPATTTADIAESDIALGCHDAAPVMAEPFRQWVIENRFVSLRPPWQRAGAEMVHDVAPFELMKLRLLNGAHSALAYLGYLAGHETVAKASADPVLAAMLERLWAEIIPVVPTPEGVDLKAYTGELLERFRNPAIRHRTWQIAMDGSQKLPQRLLGSICDRLRQGKHIAALSLGVAGWMRYVMGQDELGAAIDVRDPLQPEFAAIMAEADGDTHAIVDGLLALKAVFGDDLPRHAIFREHLLHALDALRRDGVGETLKNMMQQQI